jgi:hypothetical protein
MRAWAGSLVVRCRYAAVVTVVLAAPTCLACSDGEPDRDGADGLPVGADVSTCDELVADPLFGEEAELFMSMATPIGARPDRCTLAFDRGASVLDVLGVDTMCSPGWSVVVAVDRDSSGAWQVDPDSEQLGVDRCLWTGAP